MNLDKLESLPPPPGVLNSLRAGFDAVSSHVVLIILPAALDIFLWLGPRLGVGQLYRSTFGSLLNVFKSILSPKIILDAIDQVNLLDNLRTFPVGIPSLLSRSFSDTASVQTPLGVQQVIQIPSAPWIFGLVFLLTVVGWIGGGLYFRWVSGATLGDGEAGISPMRAITQTFILSLIWLAALMIVLTPVFVVMALLVLLSPALANGAVLILMIISFWLVVPLFFTPHGIFVQKQNALHSILSSLRMSRFTLPTSSMFVFAVFVFATGMNYLWSVPANDSWMLLVGIAGHAFITTALLSASFVYYHDMNAWLQMVFNQIQQQQKKGMPTQQA